MSTARPPRTALLATGGLALQALLLLWPATISGQAFFRRDVHLMWYAQAEVQARAWAEGSRLLWNPSASFGQPLLADANNQVFYPLSPLHAVLRPWTYYTLYAFLHLWLAGAGAAFLARRLGLGWLPAWGAGALWMASGPLLSLVDTWNQLAGAAWMPWAIAAGLGTLTRGGMRAAAAWGAATALQLLAGSPEMALLSVMGVTVLAIAQLLRRDLERNRLLRAGRGAAFAAVLALGLAACQWVPALDAARRAGRTALAREARVHWSLRPVHLAQVVCPVPLHRLALTGRTRQGLFGAPDPFLPSIYSGVVSAVLVAAALRRPGRLTLGLAVVGVSSAVLALGDRALLYDALVALVPPLQALRYPAKALLLASLAWCVLCAFGLAELAEPRRRTTPAVVAGLLALAAAAVSIVLAFGGAAVLERFLASSSIADARAFAVRPGVIALLAALAGLLLLRRDAWSARALAGLALLDLTIAHHDLNPTAPVALYTHRPPALQAGLDPEHGRLHTWDYMEPGDSERLLGREIPYLLARAPSGWDLRAAQALGLREALFPPTAFVRGADGGFDRDVPGLEPFPLARLKDAFRTATSSEARLRLLRIGGISRVAALHPGAGVGMQALGRYEGYFVDPVLVFAVPEPRPRSYVVGTARVRADDAQALATLLAPDFSPEREVVLAEGPGGAAAGFVGSSHVRERRVDRLLVETEASAPGWVVTTDAWDPGWRVTVDRVPAKLDRANVGFRAVAIPEGRHQVEFVYRPARVAPALWASAASLAMLAACLVVTRPRWRDIVGDPAAPR
jgi:hypothetical protein